MINEYQEKLNEIHQKIEIVKLENRKIEKKKREKRNKKYEHNLKVNDVIKTIKNKKELIKNMNKQEKIKEIINEKCKIDEINMIFSKTQLLIIEILKKRDMIRSDIVKELKIPRTTIYDNLYKLQKFGIVKKYSKNEGFRSRPKVFWKLINKNEGMMI